MKQWIADLLEAHGWKLLGTAITLLSTLIGSTYVYGVTDGKKLINQEITQQETTSIRTAQEELKQDLVSVRKDVSAVQQDVSEMKGKVNTMLTLLRGRQ